MEHIGRPEQEQAISRLVRHTETGEVFDINDPRYEAVEGMLRIGVYRHYKSTLESPKYYEVNKAVQNTETGEYLVIYRPLYETSDSTEAARPLDMFTGHVPVGKGKIPRFRFLGQPM